MKDEGCDWVKRGPAESSRVIYRDGFPSLWAPPKLRRKALAGIYTSLLELLSPPRKDFAEELRERNLREGARFDGDFTTSGANRR